MGKPESPDADHKPVLPPNDPAEAPTVQPEERPAISTSENAKVSTPAPGRIADNVTGPDLGATGPYGVDGGASLPPMSDPTDGSPEGAGTDDIPGHEVLGVLGRGGMGVVFKARRLSLKRLVAVKMILAGEYAGPEHLARFRTEAEVFARLQHPNIVQIFEVGEHKKMPFLCLEFCGGGSLAKKLDGTPLPPSEAAVLVQTLARAMQAAHVKGVIHRDLKPGNVLLADDGTPKITDFGLAKKLDEDGHTLPGAVMGTPSYMAPEQAEGKNVGPLADVYALGAVLYECLTGRPPFKAATIHDTIFQVIGAEPVPPRRLNPAVPRDLETICLKCLQKEPGKRYDSAQGLADDLGRFQKREPILARPAPRWERFAKWCRRNPRVAVLSGSIAVALVAASVLSWDLYRETGLKELARKDAKEKEASAAAGLTKAIANVNLVLRMMERMAHKEFSRAEPGDHRAILKGLLDQIRKLLTQLTDDFVLTQFNRVSLYQQTGDLALKLCLLHEAQDDFRTGYELVQQIVKEDPDNDKARANMAVMHLRLGNLTWVLDGYVEAARKHFDEARQLRQEIADHPRSGGFSVQNNDVALAYSAMDLGRLEFARGNLAAAREHLARALEARRAWAKAPVQEDQDLAPSFLAEACMWMGMVLAHQGDQEGADKLLQEALDLSHQLAKKDPTDMDYQLDLVEIYGVRGDVQALRGDWQGASASYLKAREYAIAMKLPTEAMDSREQVLLARTIERLGAVADQKGDAKGARGRREMSLKVRETLTRIEPACVFWKAAWLLALAHMDRQADDEAAALAKRAAGNCELLLQLARYHAVRAGKAAAPARRCTAAEQALALLSDALKAGYADRFLLAGDPDLASLRQEAGFQALLNRLAR